MTLSLGLVVLALFGTVAVAGTLQDRTTTTIGYAHDVPWRWAAAYFFVFFKPAT
jgi:hypothetical protein